MSNRARMLTLGLLTVLALVATGMFAALPASAKTCYKNVVPPGESGTSQYVEVIPTTCGSTTPPSSGAGHSGGANGSGGSIGHLGQGAAGVKRLSHMGAQGQAAAALAAATAPSPASGGSGTGGQGSASATSAGAGGTGSGGAANRVVPPTLGGSSAGALSDALSGSGSSGLGIVLPLLMGVLFGAAIVAGLTKARHRSRPSA